MRTDPTNTPSTEKASTSTRSSTPADRSGDASSAAVGLTVLPSIDLRFGRVVRLKQGDYSAQLNYDVDPVATAVGFREDGAGWVHVVDLDGAKEGRCVQVDKIGQIAVASRLRVQAGGGVRSVDDIRRLLAAGVERVVVGTKAIEDWPWFESLMAEEDLAGRITLAIDARDGIVATRGWTAASELSAVEVARRVSNWPLAALLFTDVAKDGMLQGPNTERTAELAAAGSVPVIASGGVGSLDHVTALLDRGIWGVIIGRSLYEKKVELQAALAVAGNRIQIK